MAAWLAYPQIAPAAAGAADAGRPERRGHGDCAGQPAAAAGGDPRSVEPADEPSAIAARRFSARRSGDRSPKSSHPQLTATLYDLLSAYAAQRQQRVLAHVQFAKRTVWSLRRRASRWSGWSGRPGTGAGSTSICWNTWSSRRCAPPCWRRALPPRWNWFAKARSKCTSKRRSRRSICASAAAVGIRRDDRAGPVGASNRHRRRPSHGGLAERRITTMPRTTSDRSGQGARPRNCGCWRRCCLPRPSRSTEDAGQRLPEGVDIKVALARCRRSMPRAASIWSASPTSGRSAPPAICPGC